MEIIILKYGNLMGSPDLKSMMNALGDGTPEADLLFDDLYQIKLDFGLNGQATSVLLLEPDCPDLFPALVDFSYIAADPATHDDSSVQKALDSLAENNLSPEDIKSLFITHPHGDHFDPRLLPHFSDAVVYADPESNVPGAQPLEQGICPPTLASLDTPGHGTPHCSYVIDLPEKDLSICIAGDLIMSHAHFLSLDQPLSFANHEQGRQSVQSVMDALSARPTRHKMILPGHDIPFFVKA